MNFIKKVFVCGLVGLMMWPAYSIDLTGTASVNVTSDTAATAKKMAFDEARRQIIVDVLGQYADVEILQPVVAAEKSAVLTNLIASSSISGERQSNTTYSANISMTINRQNAKNWLTENEIQNWLLSSEDGGTKFLVFADLKDKFSDWMQLRAAATGAGISLDSEMVYGNQIVFSAPSARRSAFTILMREKGWRYRNADGNLHIFK